MQTQLSKLAIDNISHSGAYDVDSVKARWQMGEYGTLHEYATGNAIRPATAEEAIASYEAGIIGDFPVDSRHDESLRAISRGEDFVTCYVTP